MGTGLAYTKLESKGDREAYQLQTDQGDFVVKITESSKSLKEVIKDVYILEYLEKFKFNSPLIIRSNSGETFIKINDRYLYLMDFITGQKPTLNNNLFERLGILLAQFHLIPVNNYPYISTYNPIYELPLLKNNLLEITENSEIKSQLLSDISNFQSFDTLPKSLIHTDIHSANLIDKNGELFLIDLDDAGTSQSIIDVGYVIGHMCTFGKNDQLKFGIVSDKDVVWNKEWVITFLKSYNSTRQLLPEELNLLHYATQFALLSYVYDWENHTIDEANYQRYTCIKNEWNDLEKLI